MNNQTNVVNYQFNNNSNNVSTNAFNYQNDNYSYQQNVNLFNYLKTRGKEILILEKDNKIIVMNIKNKKEMLSTDASSLYNYEDSTFGKVIFNN